MNEKPALLADAVEPSRVRMVITALTGFVFLAIAGVIYVLPHTESHTGPSVWATINAVLNGLATVCLVLGLVFIKQRRLDWHKRSMIAAFGLSCLFLLTYLVHHSQVGSVPFRGQGAVRAVYFGLLLPHILLAALVVPLALLTIYRGLTDRLVLHKKIAKVTLPIWLYVSVSGVVLYFMLYHL